MEVTKTGSGSLNSIRIEVVSEPAPVIEPVIVTPLSADPVIGTSSISPSTVVHFVVESAEHPRSASMKADQLCGSNMMLRAIAQIHMFAMPFKVWQVCGRDGAQMFIARNAELISVRCDSI